MGISRSVSLSSWATSSSQNTSLIASRVMGFMVRGSMSGAGFFFMSARTLYH